MAKNAGSKLTKKVSTRKRRARRPLKKNPASQGGDSDGLLASTLAEVTSMALPGLGAYAGGRAAGWLAYRVARKRSRSLARHAGPLGSMAFAVGASYASKRFEQLQKYDLPIIVGAWIAALQGVLQAYVPQYAWILGDYQMDELAAAAKAGGDAAQMQKNIDDVESMLEGYDKSYSEAFGPSQGQGQLPSSADDDFSDIPGLGDEGMNVGIFSGGLSN